MPAEWVQAAGVVGAASVTGIFSVLVHTLRRENSDRHTHNMKKLDGLNTKLDEVSDNIVGLTVWTKVHDAKHELMEEQSRGA